MCQAAAASQRYWTIPGVYATSVSVQRVVCWASASEVTRICFNPTGSLLASGSYDATARVWDIATGQCVRTLRGHAGKVYSVSFRPDDRLLASAGGEGSIRLWDVTDVRRSVACVQVLQVELPYARMNIANVTGLTPAQITSLQALGAVEEAE